MAHALKTHKGAQKRFKITKTKKVMFKKMSSKVGITAFSHSNYVMVFTDLRR